MQAIQNISTRFSDAECQRLSLDIKRWSSELGFQQTGITDTQLDQDKAHLRDWLNTGMHGEMSYMARNELKRSQPDKLQPGTIRIISVRMDYLPEAAPAEQVLNDKNQAYISRYALGRDYHKLMRRRLQRLADRIESAIGPYGYRAFVDSAPVLEKALAQKAGLGWIGKHTNLLNKEAGSWFFLGELYTDLPLPVDNLAKNHCGHCSDCMKICPTQAIIAPYRLDARRCISYLTIELKGSIPEELRPLIGNRVYGCDDCQLVCPWNRFAQITGEKDYHPRHRLDQRQLIDLFLWSEDEFMRYTEGSAIRRIGYERWLRNLAVGLGNAPANEKIIDTLNLRKNQATPMVKEHIEWALKQQQKLNKISSRECLP